MRREVALSYLKLVSVLVLGLVAGRFVVPRIEPQTIHYVTIFPHPGEKSCGMGIIDVTTVLGTKTRYGEEHGSLSCREERPFANTVIDCRCPNAP